MFDFDTDNSAVDASEVNTGTNCGYEMPVGADSHMGDTHGISFGRTGDASFDDLMSRVDQFNAETIQLTELARLEVATKTAVHSVSPVTLSTYTYNTGDAHLDNLLNDAYREMAEYRTLAD